MCSRNRAVPSHKCHTCQWLGCQTKIKQSQESPTVHRHILTHEEKQLGLVSHMGIMNARPTCLLKPLFKMFRGLLVLRCKNYSLCSKLAARKSEQNKAICLEKHFCKKKGVTLNTGYCTNISIIKTEFSRWRCQMTWSHNQTPQSTMNCFPLCYVIVSSQLLNVKTSMFVITLVKTHGLSSFSPQWTKIFLHITMSVFIKGLNRLFQWSFGY